MVVDHESVKILLSHKCLFTILGSTSVKAVCRMLMKLSPGHDIKELINSRCDNLFYNSELCQCLIRLYIIFAKEFL
jgi:hypothetical protein